MSAPDLACPVCDADLILSGDESPGDRIHCTFCGAPFLLQRRRESEEDAQALWEAEEDF